jgi:hypothetical protein
LRVKENQYKYADEQGGYTVCFGDRTIEVTFLGLLSEQLVEKFCEDLELMLRVIEWQYWGFYGDLTKCDEKSATTRDILVKLRKLYLEHGCIVEAFNIGNPMTIESIDKLKTATGLEYSFHRDSLFTNRSHAIEFIHHVLFKVENKSTKSE